MKNMRPRKDFEPGDYFWDSDGDLNLVVADHHEPGTSPGDVGRCEECDVYGTKANGKVYSVYWSGQYERGEITPDTVLPTMADGGWNSALHWDTDDDSWEVAREGFQPVSDDEVAEALASIGIAPTAAPTAACTCTPCPVHPKGTT